LIAFQLYVLTEVTIFSLSSSQIMAMRIFQFFLGLGNETLLTPEEKKGRAGIDSNIIYNDSGPKGELPRMFDDDGLERNLRRFERKLEDEVPPKKNWHTDGYTTEVKNQGK